MSAQPDEPPPSPRTPAEIREQLAYYRDPYYDAPGRADHARGVRESLRWVLGERPQSPVAGAALGRVPNCWEIEDEASRAEEGMRALSAAGAAWFRQHGRGYLTGAENALVWLSGGDDSI
ncbi:hypothetical protein [Microbispora sp. H10949]|uniref:hypothetical protein n=1 Tax=Microbispora sp. H10949 TaxID=2729111 RepID=UPI0015FF46E9|nr:hypothetical protein [Microbispora sp. H10949]